MKTTSLTLKRKVLVIELPESRNTFDDLTFLNSETKGYTLLGSPDDLKEEDVIDLVEREGENHPSYQGEWFSNYKDEECMFETAIESFNSALEKEIYWENPFENKIDGFHGEYVDNGKIAAETRTFNRTRTLIFVENN